MLIDKLDRNILFSATVLSRERCYFDIWLSWLLYRLYRLEFLVFLVVTFCIFVGSLFYFRVFFWDTCYMNKYEWYIFIRRSLFSSVEYC